MWTLSFLLEELDKVICFLFIFSSSIWESFDISLKKNAVKEVGLLSKAPTVRATFSHLFFANDLVLFAKADHVNFSMIKDVFDAFCAQSRHSIS